MGDTTGIVDATCELEGVADITGLEEGDGVGVPVGDKWYNSVSSASFN